MGKVYLYRADNSVVSHNIIKEQNKKICLLHGYKLDSLGRLKIQLLGNNGFDIQNINEFDYEVWNVLLDEAGSVIKPKINSSNNPSGLYFVSDSKSDLEKIIKNKKDLQNLNKTNPLQARKIEMNNDMRDQDKDVVKLLNEMNEDINEESKETIESNKKSVVVKNEESSEVLEDKKKKRDKKTVKRVG